MNPRTANRVFFVLLCAVATLVILSPPTPLEKQLSSRVIYIHSPGGGSSDKASASGGSQGTGAPAIAGGGALGADMERIYKDSEGAPDGVLEAEEESEDGDEDGSSAAAANDYKKCPQATAPMKPSLQGMPLDFRVGRRGLNVSDTFIHKGNYEQLLHGEYTLHRHTIPLLPNSYEDIARNYKFNSCAVVGSSGYLKLAQFGQAIDTHDVVVRLNQSPVKAFARWVGTKTTIRILNSLWSAHYGSGRYEGMNLPLEKNVTIIVSRTTGHSFDKIVDTIKKKRPDVRVLQLSSRIVSAARRLLVRYRVKLCQNGYGPYSGGSTPSSGFVAVYYLRTICKRVTLYGLGTVNIPDVPYHYFTGVGSRKKGNSVHSFDSESALLDALAWENKVEQCKYRTRDFVVHGDQIMSTLKANFTELQQYKYNNRFCGWNFCNRRMYHKLVQMVKGAKAIDFKDCKKIMFDQ